jgi:hypothetical protein
MNENYDTILFRAEDSVLIRIRVKDNKLTDDIQPFLNTQLFNSLTDSTLVIGSYSDGSPFKEFARLELKTPKENKITIYKKENVHEYINSILENIHNEQHRDTRRTK